MKTEQKHDQNHAFPDIAKKDIYIFSMLVGVHFLLVEYLITRGLEFNLSPLNYYGQFLDRSLLTTQLYKSLLYLHSQPPLYNLIMGIILKTAGSQPLFAFTWLYRSIAALTIIIFYLQIRFLGLPAGFSSLIGLFFVFNPALIAYEYHLFYPLIAAFLLLLSSFLLTIALKHTRLLYLMLFFLVILLLGTLRSSYNLGFLLIVAALVLFGKKWNIRQILIAAAPAVVLFLMLIGKNLILFQLVSPSSWLGMNLAHMTINALSVDQRQALVASDKVSDVILIPPFQEIGAYPRDLWEPHAELCSDDLPALCEPLKMNGRPNLNFIGYIPVSREYLQAGIYIIRHFPLQYLLQVKQAWIIYFKPAHHAIGISGENLISMQPLLEVVDPILCDDHERNKVCLNFAFVYCLTLIASLPYLLSYFFNPRKKKPQDLILSFLLITILYSALINTLIDVGENNRFRFESDFIFLVMLSVMLYYFLSRPAKFWYLRITGMGGHPDDLVSR